MRNLLAGLWLASTLSSGTALAQQAPFNETGVTMGHWHLVSHDVNSNNQIFVAMGGKLVTRGSAVGVWFPGATRAKRPKFSPARLRAAGNDVSGAALTDK